MTALDDVLAKLDARPSGSSWSAKCPAHPDRNPSLSISERDDGNGVVLTCHAGCTLDAILAAIGMTKAALFDEKSTTTRRRLVETYNYIDADDEIRYRVARFEPKDFRPQTTNDHGKTWQAGYNGRQRILYRLPAVLAAVAAGDPVYVVEGEKDADRLAAAGVCATTSPGGAKAWGHVADHARQVLADAVVIVIPDKDKPGEQYGRDVVTSLHGHAAAITVAQAVIGKDAADHLGAGRTVDEFELVASDHLKRDGSVTLDEWIAGVRDLTGDDDKGDDAVSVDAARLGNEFWQQTPQLAQIAQAADSRVISREAVLLAVLVNVAAHVPAMLQLPGPPRKGAPNLICIAAARPGAGKGSSADCANGLIPPPPTTKRIPLGTAEGFVKTFFELNPDKDERKERRLVRHYHPVIVRTDEIGVFVQQTGRQSASGEGLIAQLKQMCSGEALGFGYATDEKRLMVDPLSYRAGMICGVAPAKAAPLFDDRGGGLPERMIFSLAFPEFVPDDDAVRGIPCDPGLIPWRPPLRDDAELLRYSIDIDDDVNAVMRLEHLAQIRADHVGSDLDVHRTYNRLRLAVCVAWLHGDTTVTMRWHLMAEDVMRSSDAARQWLLEQITAESRRADSAGDQRHASRAVTVADAIDRNNEARQTERTVKAARRLWELVNDKRADTVGDIRRLVRQFERDEFDRGLAHAIDIGWLVETEQETISGGAKARRLTLGEVRP